MRRITPSAHPTYLALNLQLMVIFRQATGASIADLKAFDRWWGPQGVTDAPAFNAWAAQVFKS